MGLLDQLWDETVAGPRPDSGLGRLRKYASFSHSSSSSSPAPAMTRSFTIGGPPSLSVDHQSPRGESSYSSSVPSSPASGPDSPFAAGSSPASRATLSWGLKSGSFLGSIPAVLCRIPQLGIGSPMKWEGKNG